MCFRYKASIVAALLGTLALGPHAQADDAPRQVLRVAADPNNLPFSNRREEGFENRIARLIAQKMRVELVYTWRAQRRGFFRETLQEGNCDIAMGVPGSYPHVLTTQPYYYSMYVFAYRRDQPIQVHSLNDPELRHLKIGVLLAGDTRGNTPPVQALARRGIITNVVGFTLYGDYAQDNPPGRIVRAVAAGELDLAIVWGPLAGYFGARQQPPLKIVPIGYDADVPGEPVGFEMCIGVRRGESRLRDTLNGILEQSRSEIDRVLNEFNLPRMPLAPEKQ